ncbi:MAG: hypothetical protein KAW12_12320 [Candidatus Aminicenantes bacterium]|nr:hypothetical protein [Candidatus Aminicenantes bacterium]
MSEKKNFSNLLLFYSPYFYTIGTMIRTNVFSIQALLLVTMGLFVKKASQIEPQETGNVPRRGHRTCSEPGSKIANNKPGAFYGSQKF